MNKLAKIKDYGFGTTKNGDPQVVIVFACDDKNRMWYGTLKEGKGREITFNTLLLCGFRGKSVSEIADGPNSMALDMQKELMLVTEIENTHDGKQVERVKWVNDPSVSAIKEKLSKDDVVLKLKGMNIESEFNFFKASRGHKEHTSEDIPF